jgi:hypothetical protein
MRRSSTTLPKDSNQLAAAIVRLSTEETNPNAEPSSISEYLSQIGRKGGLKGGKARAAKLSPARRKAIAQKAAKKRWKSPAKKSLP